jgi:hypothetical protein
MSSKRIGLIILIAVALLMLSSCFEHSRCIAYPEEQLSQDGSGKVITRFWVCKRGLLSRERFTTVDVGVTKWGGLSDRVFRIENKHEVTARWDGPNHVVLTCHDVNGDKISEKLDSLKLTSLQCDPSKSGVIGPEGLVEVSETISISYDLK